MEKIDVSIILPVFNEEKTIANVIDKLLRLSLRKEIIVVNDGSTDLTPEILKKFQANNCLKILEHGKNLGKGVAIRTGIKEAQGDFIIIQDGDLEQDPQDILNLLRVAKERNLEVIFGTRVLNRGFQFDIRYVANMLFALLTNILFRGHLSDIMTGYKLCKTDIIKGIKLDSNGFDIEPEITAKLLKQKRRICEIPVSYNPRTAKEGKKIRFRDSFKIVGRLLLEKIAN